MRESFGIICRKAVVSPWGQGWGDFWRVKSWWSVGGMKGEGVCRDATVQTSAN